ncbi:MAG: hypothetical protein J6B28_00390 [Eubacterium sp.]|nr:hypothetical protein [Eubacterium sp.]
MRRKNKQIKFTNRGYSRLGIGSMVLSALSLSWLLYALRQTFLVGDQAEKLLGGIGMLVLILQVIALRMGIKALKEEDVFRGIPKVSVLLAVLLLLIWLAVYGLGIYTMVL